MSESKTSSRLLSLDALRGYTIVAMIIVNTPGTWSAMYPPLQHASWHGLTPTDLIFPFFLFIVGVSIALSLGKKRDDASLRPSQHRKILVRVAKIFAVGLFLNLWPGFDFGEIRVAGVLQRIAIVFGITAILFLHLRWRALAGVTAGLCLGYWALLTLVPVPQDTVIRGALEGGQIQRAHGSIESVEIESINETMIVPNLEPATNLAAWVDRRFLPGAQYEQNWDPEGLLSTLPSIATALLGVLTGLALAKLGSVGRKSRALLIGGVALLTLGYLWSLVFPLNKNLWTSSYVLVSAGWALVLFGAAVWLVDGKGWRRGAYPGIVFGANAITAYVLAGVLTWPAFADWIAGRSSAEWVLSTLTEAGTSLKFASMAFSLLYAALIFLPVWWLYRRRIFIRL